MRRALIIFAAFLVALILTYLGLKETLLRMSFSTIKVACWFPLALAAAPEWHISVLLSLVHYQIYVAAFGYLIHRKPVLWSLSLVLTVHAALVVIALSLLWLISKIMGPM